MLLNLRDIAADVLRALFLQPGYFCLGFAPVVDGILLPDEPIALRRRGEFQKVKLMTGLLKDDGSFFTVQCKDKNLNTLWLRQNGCHFADIFKSIFMSDNFWNPNEISLEYVHHSIWKYNSIDLYNGFAQKQAITCYLNQCWLVYSRKLLGLSQLTRSRIKWWIICNTLISLLSFFCDLDHTVIYLQTTMHICIYI